MKQSFFFYLVAICMLFTYCAPAKTKKKHKVYLKLVEAYTQRTVPGIPGPPPPTGTHLIVIWEASTAPETFFWRGDGGWLGCNMVKAHKSAKKAGGHARGADYYTESVMPEQVGCSPPIIRAMASTRSSGCSTFTFVDRRPFLSASLYT